MKAKKIIIRSLIVVIVIIIGLYIFGVATGNNVPKEEPKQEEKETKEDTQKEEEKDQFNPNDIVVADYADKTTDEYINAFIDGGIRYMDFLSYFSLFFYLFLIIFYIFFDKSCPFSCPS